MAKLFAADSSYARIYEWVMNRDSNFISEKDKERLKIDEGIQVLNLTKGKLKDAGVKVGFIVTDINKMAVSSVEDIKRVLSQASSKKPVLIEGVYPGGDWTYYVFNMEE